MGHAMPAARDGADTAGTEYEGKIGFHAGKVSVERPRVRGLAGQELALPSWEHAVAEDWLGKWAMNLMLINVSTRKFRRAVRLPEAMFRAGGLLSKSAVRGTLWRCRRAHEGSGRVRICPARHHGSGDRRHLHQ